MSWSSACSVLCQSANSRDVTVSVGSPVAIVISPSSGLFGTTWRSLSLAAAYCVRVLIPEMYVRGLTGCYSYFALFRLVRNHLAVSAAYHGRRRKRWEGGRRLVPRPPLGHLLAHHPLLHCLAAGRLHRRILHPPPSFFRVHPAPQGRLRPSAEGPATAADVCREHDEHDATVQLSTGSGVCPRGLGSVHGVWGLRMGFGVCARGLDLFTGSVVCERGLDLSTGSGVCTWGLCTGSEV